MSRPPHPASPGLTQGHRQPGDGQDDRCYDRVLQPPRGLFLLLIS